MRLLNSTSLCGERLLSLLAGPADGWPHGSLDVHVRYSRRRDFSGLCNYRTRRIHINLGRHLRFPYDIKTYLARAQSNARIWWREIYCLRVTDAYQLALFIFLHEFYHWLVRQARRNTRQKESMCDRFAARVLVDQYGAAVLDAQGQAVPRPAWDFQDLEGFVAAARSKTAAVRRRRCAARSPVADSVPRPVGGDQLLLFPLDQ